MNKELAASIKSDYELLDLPLFKISEKHGVSEIVIQNILNGLTGNGSGKSEMYRNSKWTFTKNDTDIVKDYENGVSMIDIQKKYNIKRNKIYSVIKRYNIPERQVARQNYLKSITLEVDGTIKTYPSVESAARQTGIPSDFLHKLKNEQVFGLGKTSTRDVAIVYDKPRIDKLERCAELVGLIFYGGTLTDKAKFGEELKLLIQNLGYGEL